MLSPYIALSFPLVPVSESGILVSAANFADTPPMVLQHPLPNAGSRQSSTVVSNCSYQSIPVAPADFEMVSNVDSYVETEEHVVEYDPITSLRRRVRYNR